MTPRDGKSSTSQASNPNGELVAVRIGDKHDSQTWTKTGNQFHAFDPSQAMQRIVSGQR